MLNEACQNIFGSDYAALWILINWIFFFSNSAHCRLGEPYPFRGRQTLCKYYSNNEILNEQLLQIKSAHTVQEFEKLFDRQLRHNQGYVKSAKSIEPYYDIKDVLNPLKTFTSETCLCTKDPYRLNNNRVVNERQRTPSPAAGTTNAIKSLNCKSSIEEFVHLASDCYDKCINIYLDNLNDCNRRAEIIERQLSKSPSGYTGKRTLKSRKINDLSLANRINKLNINLDAYHRDVTLRSSDNFQSVRQSTSQPNHCRTQTMSCNDTNNNSTESTNQLKDPPKIILSDHSTAHQTIHAEKIKDYIESNSSTDKNCLTIPTDYYTSEARPP